MKIRNPSSNNQKNILLCNCTSIEEVGRFVYLYSVDVDGTYNVRNASCDDIDKMPSIGVIIKKTSPVKCFVQTSGIVNDVFSGLVSGKTYKVDGSGDIVVLAPSPGIGGYSMVQFIGLALGDSSLNLSIDFNMKKAVVG